MESEEGTLKGRIEAILFVAGEAVSGKELARALQTEETAVRDAISALRDEYDYEQRGFLLNALETRSSSPHVLCMPRMY